MEGKRREGSKGIFFVSCSFVAVPDKKAENISLGSSAVCILLMSSTNYN